MIASTKVGHGFLAFLMNVHITGWAGDKERNYQYQIFNAAFTRRGNTDVINQKGETDI